MFKNPLGRPNPAISDCRLVVTALFCVGVAVGCRPAAADPAVLDQELSGQVVFATTKCEVGNADGVQCDKKTCKADDKSNCEYFGSRCLATGHKYTGTKDAGTCTREPGGQ